jgi:uncharacterized protein YecE (DUF72 family)
LLHIGTCSWKYDSWRGLIYSDRPDLNHLEEYAQKYDTVEIDQWFWSLHGPHSVTLPKIGVVNDYLRVIPENFTFSIKVPNSVTLTHFYRKNKSDTLVPNPYFLNVDLFHRFLESIESMGQHLGPLMFQFEYLNQQKMTSQTDFHEQFHRFISQCPESYLYAVEIRNPDYLNHDYFTFLKTTGLKHVFLQGYYMPSIVEVYKKTSHLIEDAAVIRLLGPDRKGIEKKAGGEWNRIVASKDEGLPGILNVMRDLMSGNVEIWLNVNNHFEGSAPLTIDKIKSGLSI